MTECPDDSSRILAKLYEDEYVLVEKVLGELIDQDHLDFTYNFD